MTYHLAQAAIEDLESIDDYTVRTWGTEQADRYLAMLWATFEQIGANPSRWRLRPELHPDCRICPQPTRQRYMSKPSRKTRMIRGWDGLSDICKLTVFPSSDPADGRRHRERLEDRREYQKWISLRSSKLCGVYGLEGRENRLTSAAMDSAWKLRQIPSSILAALSRDR